MAANKIIGDTQIEGNLTIVNGDILLATADKEILPDRPRSNLQQEPLVDFPVPFDRLFVWDSGQPLPATAATDDLAFKSGTFGTSVTTISAGDCKTLGATTRRARFLYEIPPEYDAGETFTIRVRTKMGSNAADTSCTVDIEAYLDGEDGLISGVDLCATAAQSMNSTATSNKDFTITPTVLTPGKKLDVRLTIVCTDGAGASTVEPLITKLSALMDIRG
jgi:hypothetical protein